jgi:hypothetical protein
MKPTIFLLLIFCLTAVGCSSDTEEVSGSYDTLAACKKINLVARDSALCACVSENIGDSSEAVAVMEWLEVDKKTDEMGFPLFGWMTTSIAKDETRESEMSELLKAMGEDKTKKLMECIVGPVK